MKEKTEKVKKKQVVRIGVRNGRVCLLWLLFILGFAFAVYKHFTAIDTHTVHEERVIEETLLSTHPMEHFVQEFAKIYFAWGVDNVEIQARAEHLENYVASELLPYARGMIHVGSVNASSVTSLDIWEVEAVSENEYKVTLFVGQVIKGGSEHVLKTKYDVVVYVDEHKEMVITKLPVITNTLQKSAYKSPVIREIHGLDVDVKAGIHSFLEDFFTVYPVATESELKYYANENTMAVIGNTDYKLSVIDKVVIESFEDDVAEVVVQVLYTSEITGTNQMFAYRLVLNKGDNWKIVEVH